MHQQHVLDTGICGLSAVHTSKRCCFTFALAPTSQRQRIPSLSLGHAHSIRCPERNASSRCLVPCMSDTKSTEVGEKVCSMLWNPYSRYLGTDIKPPYSWSDIVPSCCAKLFPFFCSAKALGDRITAAEPLDQALSANHLGDHSDYQQFLVCGFSGFRAQSRV